MKREVQYKKATARSGTILKVLDPIVHLESWVDEHPSPSLLYLEDRDGQRGIIALNDSMEICDEHCEACRNSIEFQFEIEPIPLYVATVGPTKYGRILVANLVLPDTWKLFCELK